MTIIFRAKTNNAYTIKILIELLSQNIKTACFEISKEGINLTMMDSNRIFLVKLNLEAENFNHYKYNKTDPLLIGINLNHFHKMI